eukprot:249878-Prymnesium_polylepis.2
MSFRQDLSMWARTRTYGDSRLGLGVQLGCSLGLSCAPARYDGARLRAQARDRTGLVTYFFYWPGSAE